jgi:hypothetical protein
VVGTLIFLAVHLTILNRTDKVKCISQSIIPLIASKVTHRRKVPMEKRERMRAI